MRKLLLKLIFSITSFCYANCNFINNDVKSFMNKNQINGVAIAIVEGTKTQYCNYGYADSNHNIKISQKTLFDIASLSKTFTANLVAIAELENRLDMTKSITSYLPELKINSYYSQINSIQLLTHVANIPSKLDKTYTKSDLVNSLNKVKYSTKPETNYIYSNPGIAITGMILESVYHQSFQEILTNQLLNKLNMHYTFVHITSQFQDLLSSGFSQNNKIVPPKDYGALTPSGGLKSNTEDLAIYLQYQINGSRDNTLNQALNLIHKDYYCINGHEYQQLAWSHFPDYNLDKNNNDKQILQTNTLTKNCNFKGGFIAKSGTLYGMSSYIEYSPKYKDGIVILINKGLVDDRVKLANKILQILENNHLNHPYSKENL